VYAALQTALPEHLALAASPQLAENSRLGFAPVASTSQWASGFVISSNTLGLSGSLYDGRVRSRSTGKERDAESGNDYFGARYYASSMGRFMSPDWSAKEEPVPYANLEEPQSLNLYAYAGNNPLSRADADGHFWEEMKNLWNWGHYVNNAGLNAALQKEADQDRADLSKMHGFTINGKSPAEAANGSNQDVIRADKAAFEYLSNAVNNSKQMIGGLLVVGLVDPAAAEKTAVGLGITGTKAATTIAEKLAIEAAESNPTAGKVLQTTLKDARWPSSAGWVKMESRSPGGVVVHWVRNTITGAVADFKLK
jgi:RHS repeat-associated protein